MTSSSRLGYKLRAIMMLNASQITSATSYTYWYWYVSTRVAGVAFNEERELS